MTILHHIPVEYRRINLTLRIDLRSFWAANQVQVQYEVNQYHNLPPDELWASFPSSLLLDSPSTTLVKYPVRGRGGANPLALLQSVQWSHVCRVFCDRDNVSSVLPVSRELRMGRDLFGIYLNPPVKFLKWRTLKLKATTNETPAELLLTTTFRFKLFISNCQFLRFYFNIL